MASKTKIVRELTAAVCEFTDAGKSLLRRLSEFDRLTVVSFLNANAVVLACRDSAFREALMGADYLLRDGVGCELLMHAVGRSPGPNANGTDFIPRLVEELKARRFALYGTSEPYLEIAVSRLTEMGVSVVDQCDGFQEFEFYIDRLRQVRPDVLILGMGMPKQELLTSELRRKNADTPMLVVSGGAIVDFWAGRFPRAPIWMRHCRLEWLYRFSLEPRRLFRRYFVDGVAFLWLIVKSLYVRTRVS